MMEGLKAVISWVFCSVFSCNLNSAANCSSLKPGGLQGAERVGWKGAALSAQGNNRDLARGGG